MAIKASLLFLLVITGSGGAVAQSLAINRKRPAWKQTLRRFKQAMLGNWEEHCSGGAAERS